MKEEKLDHSYGRYSLGDYRKVVASFKLSKQ